MRAFLAALLTIAAVTAAADVEVSAPRLQRRAASQFDVTVASAGGDFIAVWVDTSAQQLRATRIGADGSVLDPASFHVTGPASVWTPSIARTDSAYRVVYEVSGQTYATTVSRNGTPGEPKLLLTGAASLPQIASTAAGTIVAARGFQGIRIAALDADGAVIHETFIPTLMFDGPQVVPLGNAFLVVWAQEAPQQPMAAIEAAIVSAGGELVGQPRVVAAQGWTPAVASIGDRALVTWERPIVDNANPFALAPNVFGRIVTPTTLSDELTIATVSEPRIQTVSIAAHRDAFALVWTELAGQVPVSQIESPPWIPSYDLYGAAVSLQGEIRPGGLIVHGSDSAENPELVSNGQRLLLSWTDHSLTTGRMRIAAGLLTDIGAPVEPLDIALSASNQENPRAATAGGITVAVWTEDPSNGERPAVYVRRLDAGGRFLDEAARKWSGTERVIDRPSVAVGAEGFGVAWRDENRRLYARRMRLDGLPIDAAPLSVGDGGMMTAAIASDGENFAVLTIESGTLGTAVIRASGSVEHHSLMTPYAAGGWSPVALAWDGARYVAAFPLPTNTSTPVGVVTRQQINIVAFSPDGAVLSGPTAVTSTNEDHSNPSLACRNGSCLLAWSGWSGIDGALLSGSDRVTQLGMLAAQQSYFPQVTTAPAGYNVGWVTYEDATTALHLQPFGANGIATAPAGVVARFDGIASTDVATDASGSRVIAYSQIVEGKTYGGTKRVLVRSGAPERRRAAGR